MAFARSWASKYPSSEGPASSGSSSLWLAASWHRFTRGQGTACWPCLLCFQLVFDNYSWEPSILQGLFTSSMIPTKDAILGISYYSSSGSNLLNIYSSFIYTQWSYTASELILWAALQVEKMIPSPFHTLKNNNCFREGDCLVQSHPGIGAESEFKFSSL